MSISIILGIVGIVSAVLTWFITLPYGILGWVAFVSWIVGLIIGIKDAKSGNGSGKAGAVICGIMLGLYLLLIIILFAFAGAMIGAIGATASTF